MKKLQLTTETIGWPFAKHEWQAQSEDVFIRSEKDWLYKGTALRNGKNWLEAAGLEYEVVE